MSDRKPFDGAAIRACLLEYIGERSSHEKWTAEETAEWCGRARDAGEKFCEHFNAHGWPDGVDEFALVLTDTDGLYAGFSLHGRHFLWFRDSLKSDWLDRSQRGLN